MQEPREEAIRQLEAFMREIGLRSAPITPFYLFIYFSFYYIITIIIIIIIIIIYSLLLLFLQECENREKFGSN